MPTEKSAEYSTKDITFLLAQARKALVEAANHVLYKPEPSLVENLSPALLEHRACFITLMMREKLRGCIGTVLARMPLYQEVIFSTYQTALSDPRFAPVAPKEVAQIEIELSILTPPQSLSYASASELPELLRPFTDGVILRAAGQVGTFLPQVWEKIPVVEDFLGALCRKMNLPENFWLAHPMEVQIYQALKYREPDYPTQT